MSNKSAIIMWPPETRNNRFPRQFLNGNKLAFYWPKIQQVSCRRCGFTVEWVIVNEDYSLWNADTRRTIRESLAEQCRQGKCSEHPNPYLFL